MQAKDMLFVMLFNFLLNDFVFHLVLTFLA